MQKIKKFIRCYRGFSIMVVNTIILFIIFNLICLVVIKIHTDISVNQKFYSDEVLREIYPNLSEDQINKLLKETRSLFLIYEPFLQYREPTFKGEFVNVNENGFREIKNQCTYPLDSEKFNIFVFGGSTTFGYYVNDSETIASYLQEIILKNCSDVCVYNFGRGGYFSTLERIFFEKLLLEDQTPDMAIFIDGLNDFYFLDGNPMHTQRIYNYMARTSDYSNLYQNLPLFRVITYILPKSELYESKEGDVNDAFLRLIRNQEMINLLGEEFNVKTYFVIQPVPNYNYNLSYHIPYTFDALTDFGRHDGSALGYPLLAEHYSNEKNVVWLADIQRNKTENLYVDTVHYNPEFSKEIAQYISNKINVC